MSMGAQWEWMGVVTPAGSDLNFTQSCNVTCSPEPLAESCWQAVIYPIGRSCWELHGDASGTLWVKEGAYWYIKNIHFQLYSQYTFLGNDV